MFDWGKFRNFAVWKEQETPFPNPFPVEGKGEEGEKVSIRKGGDGCWVMAETGDRCWVTAVTWVPKKTPYAGRFRGSSTSTQVRFNSVPSPFQVRSLKWDLHGSHLGGTLDFQSGLYN